MQHYWLGTKLLWADIRISSRLLLKLASGKSLSRREKKQLTRTIADIFRLVPVAVFLIVPFMEFLLPVFLKLFPNMLPSTFQDKMKEEVMIVKTLKNFLTDLLMMNLLTYNSFDTSSMLLMESESFTLHLQSLDLQLLPVLLYE